MSNDDSKSEERAWAALLEAYRKVTKLKDDEQSRLYHFAGAYLAGALTLITVLGTRADPLKPMPPLFYVAASTANTFYVVFYSYVSAHLILASVFLQRLAKEAERFIGVSADFLKWEAFSASEQARIRQFINVPLTIWHAVPLTLAIILPFYAMESFDRTTRIAGIISFFLALSAGVGSCIGSMLYARSKLMAMGRDEPKPGILVTKV